MPDTTDKLVLGWGANSALPAHVTTAWGARLIFPADLLFDRQDLKAADEASKAALIAWLNGEVRGAGAIRKALDQAEILADRRELSPSESRIVTLYEDATGVVVGNPQSSAGYLYVAAWLKTDA